MRPAKISWFSIRLRSVSVHMEIDRAVVQVDMQIDVAEVLRLDVEREAVRPVAPASQR